MRSTRVAIALRYSSDKQHARSLEDQRRNCEAYVGRQSGWQIDPAWVVEDAAKSGSTTAGRAGFLRLMEAARRSPAPFEVLVVDDVSRLTRESDVMMRTFKELQVRGIRLIGVSDGFDSARGAGAKMEIGLRGIMAEAYLDDLRAKTHRGLTGQHSRGFWTGGTIYGYRTVAKHEDGPAGPHGERRVAGYTVEVFEPEADVVRRIFADYVDGKSINSIVRALNEEGIPWPGARAARNRKGWTHVTVASLLDADRYAGTWVWNKRKWYRDPTTGKRRYVERPQEEWVRREEPDLAIVDARTWKAAQARRAANRERFPRFGSGPTAPASVTGSGGPIRYLLSGLLKCGVCGGAITIIGGRGEYRTYGCTAAYRKGRAFCANNRTVSRLKIEKAVIDGIRDQILRPDLIERFVKRFVAKLREELQSDRSRRRIEEIDQDVKKLQAENERLVDLYAADGTSAAAVKKGLAAREARIAALRAEADDLRGHSVADVAIPHPAVIKGFLTDLAGTLASADQSEVRGMLERHVGQITLTPKKEGPKPIYAATGLLDISTCIRSEVVAGARNSTCLQTDPVFAAKVA